MGLKQAIYVGLAVHDLALRRDMELGAVEQEQLVAPELQRPMCVEQLVINLRQQAISRHTPLP